MRLPSFDPSRATEDINYQRAHFQLPTSLVALVGSSSETVVQVYFGTHDQVAAAEMDTILLSTAFPKDRFILSSDSRFEALCSKLLQLRMPLVCRKADTIWHAKGYLVDPAEFYLVMKAAHKKEYRTLSSHSIEKQYSIDNTFQGYNLIGLSFRK